MKVLILLSGKSQSGKNTFANFLTEEFIKLNYKVNQDAFANGVKQCCFEDFQVLADYLNNYIEKLKAQLGAIYEFTNKVNPMFQAYISNVDRIIDELKITCKDNWFEKKTALTRAILQIYGTQIFRTRVDKDWWAKQLKHRLTFNGEIQNETWVSRNNNNDITIVTDCRFPNEIEVFNDLSEEWKVLTIRIERNLPAELLYNHASETSLDNWDNWNYIIENKNSLDVLKEQAKVVAENIISETFNKPKIEVFNEKSYLFINDDGFPIVC